MIPSASGILGFPVFQPPRRQTREGDNLTRRDGESPELPGDSLQIRSWVAVSAGVLAPAMTR